MHAVARASTALQHLSKASDDIVGTISQSVELLGGGYREGVTNVVNALHDAAASIATADHHFSLCQAISVDDLIQEDLSAHTHHVMSNVELEVQEFLNVQLQSIRNYRTSVRYWGSRVDYARNCFTYITEKVLDTYAQLELDAAAEFQVWLDTTFSVEFAHIVSVDFLQPLLTRDLNSIDAQGWTHAILFENGQDEDVSRERLRGNIFGFIVGTPLFLNGLQIAQRASEACDLIEGALNMTFAHHPAQMIFTTCARDYFPAKIGQIKSFLQRMTLCEDKETKSVLCKPCGSVLRSKASVPSEHTESSRQNLKRQTAVQDQHRRLLQKRTTMRQENINHENSDFAELLHALKRLEIENQVLAGGQKSSQQQTATHVELTIENAWEPMEALSSGLALHEITKEVLTLLFAFNDMRFEAILGTGTMHSLATCWSEVCVEYLAWIENGNGVDKARCGHIQVSHQFGLLLTAAFVTRVSEGFEAVLLQCLAQTAANSANSDAFNGSSAVRRQRERFHKHVVSEIGAAITHELCEYHMVFNLLTYSAMPDATYTGNYEEGQRYEEAVPSALLISSIDWLQCVIQLVKTSLPESQEKVISSVLFQTFERIAGHSSWGNYRSILLHTPDNVSEVVRRLMLDMHLLLYNASFVEGQEGGDKNRTIPPYLWNAASSVFSKCKELLPQGDGGKEQDSFFFESKPQNWFVGLASVYSCEEADDL